MQEQQRGQVMSRWTKEATSHSLASLKISVIPVCEVHRCSIKAATLNMSANKYVRHTESVKKQWAAA